MCSSDLLVIARVAFILYLLFRGLLWGYMDGVIWNGSKKEEKENWRWADIKNLSFFSFLFLYSLGALVCSLFFFYFIPWIGW